MCLLDTDVLSNLLRRKPSASLIAKISSIPRGQQFTSSITLGEMLYGAYRMRDRTHLFLQRIRSIFQEDLPVLPFDRSAAERYGRLRADLDRRGTPLADADLRIGSIALARGLTVVTGNVRHFQRIPGLAVENWLADPI